MPRVIVRNRQTTVGRYDRCVLARIALASVTFLLTACSGPVPVDPEELEVARTVLASWSFGRTAAPGQVLHEDLQLDPFGEDDVEETFASMRQQADRYDDRLVEAVDDLQAKMRDGGSVVSLGFGEGEVVLIDDDELASIFRPGKGKKDGWELFYELHPQSAGIGRLSRVGLSRDLDFAVIAQGNQSHWLMGAGSVLVFRYDDGCWKLLDWRIGPRWIS